VTTDPTTDANSDTLPEDPAAPEQAPQVQASQAQAPQAQAPQVQASQAQESANDTAGNAEPEASVEEQLRAEAARLKDQLLRLAADFDNFRKRSRREIADAERMAREDIIRELLPVFDNLERASQHAGAATDVQSLVDGIAMVNRLFMDTLSRLGVERVATVGVAFDPAVHEAVQQIATADQPPGAVCAEVVGGYRLGERLIRPAMVVVAKAPA
jgi:molecular chaperone GrpE